MSNFDLIEKKVKDFVQEQIDDAEEYSTTPQDVIGHRAIAYGAMQFAANNLFPCYNTDLALWWDDVAWVKFNNLIKRMGGEA